MNRTNIYSSFLYILKFLSCKNFYHNNDDKSNNVENEEDDLTFVRQMLTDINSETTPKSVKRIRKEPQGNRPLKVGFESVAERDNVLGKLHKLKNKNHYLRINITEDFIEDKRIIVKTWLKRAKEKCGDCEDNQIRDFIWKRSNIKHYCKQERFIEAKCSFKIVLL